MLGRAAKIGLTAGLGGALGGPAGAVGLPAAVKVAGLGRRGAKSLRNRTMALHSRAIDASPNFATSNPRLARASSTMARRPVLTGLAGASVVGGGMSNRSPSARNQNSYYLRRIRQHQQSNALSRLVGSSTGSYA